MRAVAEPCLFPLWPLGPVRVYSPTCKAPATAAAGSGISPRNTDPKPPPPAAEAAAATGNVERRPWRRGLRAPMLRPGAGGGGAETAGRKGKSEAAPEPAHSARRGGGGRGAPGLEGVRQEGRVHAVRGVPTNRGELLSSF